MQNREILSPVNVDNTELMSTQYLKFPILPSWQTMNMYFFRCLQVSCHFYALNFIFKYFISIDFIFDFFLVAKSTPCNKNTFQLVSKHRNYTNGTPRLRHFPLYVGTGHASDILRSNAVNKFSINALKLSKLEIDQNFEGVYPKLCVTLERTFGTSRMEKLKRYFNFALGKG